MSTIPRDDVSPGLTVDEATTAGVAEGRFFLPGPTEVHHDVLGAQVRPMIGHRGAEIEGLIDRCVRGLQPLFGTDRRVFIATASATGLMEGAIRNGSVSRVLALVNGAFSERFAVIAEACGRDVERFSVPWGEAHDPAEVGAKVHTGDFDAVTVVHSETSTGVLQDLPRIAEAVRGRSDALVLVDSVTGVGGAEMRADAWGLDFVLTGSQKAMALPPGLAFGVASDRLMARAASVPDRGIYFDFIRFASSLEKNQTPTTPAVSTLFALGRQLDRIEAEGVDQRWSRHLDLATRTAEWVESMAAEGVGLTMLTAPHCRSPTVSCIRVPSGWDGPAVAKAMMERGWVIGAGYGQLKSNTIRIGHMGEHTVEELDALLTTLEGVFR